MLYEVITAANEIIPDAYEKAAEECGLDIVSRPEIDVEQIEKGKSFIFTADRITSYNVCYTKLLRGQLHALQYLKWCRGGEFTPNPWDVKKNMNVDQYEHRDKQ